MGLNTIQICKIVENIGDYLDKIDSLCMLGKQTVFADLNIVGNYLKSRGINYDKLYFERNSHTNEVDSVELFMAIGISDVHSIDIEAGEGADIIIDLNELISDIRLKEHFDLIINGGTLEHVFDITTAMKNVTYMLKNGGYVIHMAPCAGYVDHGFFSFSPTYFIDYYEANSFLIKSLFLDFVFDANPNTLQWESFYSKDCRLYGDWKTECMDINTLVDNIKRQNEVGRVLLWCIAQKKKTETMKIPMQGLYRRLYSEKKEIYINENDLEYSKIVKCVQSRENKKVALFCQGYVCNLVIDELYKQDLEKKIIGIYDNDIRKAGTVYRSFPVLNPSEKKLSEVDVIIICSIKYETEIKNQLKYLYKGEIVCVSEICQ